MIVIYKEFISLIAKIKLFIYIMSKNIYKYKIKYTNLIGGSNPQDIDDNTIKFKNKTEWPLNTNEIQWSSRNIDLIGHLVWGENDIGKYINNYSFDNSSSGFYIKIHSVGFRPEAFTNESRPIINNLLRSNNIEYNYDDNVFPEGL